jgi:LysR family transcriptional regulator, carnitine catabolism transcriptional activator
MDSRKLAHFVAVVDNGGFTAAADVTGTSQPALSIAVRDLETELGVPLFERVGRRVQLTEAGHALVGPARLVLRDLDTGRAAVAAVAGLEAGSLHVASLPTLAADPLAGLVGRYRQRHPGVVVDLAAPEDTSDLLAMIRDGRCEVGVTEAADFPGDLAGHEIGEQPLTLILPSRVPAGLLRRGRGARDGRLPTVALTDLTEVPFVATPAGTSTRRLLDEGFAAVGARPTVAVVTAQRDAIIPLVVSGAGAALVPAPLAASAAASGAILAVPVPAVSRRIAVVHRQGSLSPAATHFVALARQPQPGTRADAVG